MTFTFDLITVNPFLMALYLTKGVELELDLVKEKGSMIQIGPNKHMSKTLIISYT